MDKEEIIKLLDQVYETLANKITDRDYKLTHEIQGVLDKIDELQNQILDLNTQTMYEYEKKMKAINLIAQTLNKETLKRVVKKLQKIINEKQKFFISFVETL